jgi:hypothetical protein
MDTQNDKLYSVSEQPVMGEQAAVGMRAACAALAQTRCSERVSHSAHISKMDLNYCSLGAL